MDKAHATTSGRMECKDQAVKKTVLRNSCMISVSFEHTYVMPKAKFQSERIAWRCAFDVKWVFQAGMPNGLLCMLQISRGTCTTMHANGAWWRQVAHLNNCHSFIFFDFLVPASFYHFASISGKASCCAMHFTWGFVCQDLNLGCHHGHRQADDGKVGLGQGRETWDFVRFNLPVASVDSSSL